MAREPASGSVFDYLRKLWYRFDRKYFEYNEASIDIDRLARDHAALFRLDSACYGGNIAYLTVGLTMALRIPVSWAAYYGAAAIRAEGAIQPLQSRLTSLWVAAELRKLPSSRPYPSHTLK